MTPCIQPFFDSGSCTFSYVVYQADGSPCAIIDSVLDYDHKSGRTGTTQADEIAAFVRSHGLQVQWLLETHAHADHLSAAPYLRSLLGGKIAIGEGIRQVQKVFKSVFNLEPTFRLDGSQFDHLLAPGETFSIGNLQACAVHVPGHTPADMAFVLEQHWVFVGDTLFMPDVGTARCDFPGGDAHQLYRSIRHLLGYPADTHLYVCHDYPPQTRTEQCHTTVGEQRRGNLHVRDGVSEEQFVEMRSTRDADLPMPVLLMPAVQVNIRAGELPPAEDNGVRYLKIPLDRL
ncbi:MBL fold metallo-hydrolase [Pseudomonas abieticivorans]|uniref:MBL fold metallo-hydrolase n=1 Tax=Pseudomonas abieticivorans TaxID=2931382 RepID=UPI0020BD472E|nr:MBL fold metallo-hydrolase [Pseudomonas sp. PIA16]